MPIYVAFLVSVISLLISGFLFTYFTEYNAPEESVNHMIASTLRVLSGIVVVISIIAVFVTVVAGGSLFMVSIGVGS